MHKHHNNSVSQSKQREFVISPTQGYRKPLSHQMILQRASKDPQEQQLQHIKNINVWGSDVDGLEILREMPNLEVISLSLNKITTLRDVVNCSKVTEIYLRKNNIQDLKEISYLSKLNRLKVVWLSHNPCADHPYYRAFVIQTIPSLVKLDNAEVTQTERDQAKGMNFIKIFAEKPSLVQSATTKPRATTPTPVGKLQPGSAYQQSAKHGRKESNSVLQSHDGNRPATQTSSEVKAGPVLNRAHSSVQLSSAAGSKAQNTDSSQNNQKQHQRQGSNVEPAKSVLEPRVVQMTPAAISQQNIVCAMLALLKELDTEELELVKREINKKQSSNARII